MYKKVLVPLDGSELAECVLPHVESIARGCGTQSVVFLRVVEPFVYMMASGWENGGSFFSGEEIERINSTNRAAAKHYLDQLVSRIKYDGVNIQSAIVIGKAADSIAEYAVKNGVDLIAIATHGRSGVSRWVWGSVADRVLRSASVPILMVRAPGCLPPASPDAERIAG
ncbi:MAG: universal stress protein [Chloroflexi bacterium]|nr:universal stress protein [Chloroflexota bacterium]